MLIIKRQDRIGSNIRKHSVTRHADIFQFHTKDSQTTEVFLNKKDQLIKLLLVFNKHLFLLASEF